MRDRAGAGWWRRRRTLDTEACLHAPCPGSYVLKIVGGGPALDNIREYSEEEVYRFNSPLDK